MSKTFKVGDKVKYIGSSSLFDHDKIYTVGGFTNGGLNIVIEGRYENGTIPEGGSPFSNFVLHLETPTVNPTISPEKQAAAIVKEAEERAAKLLADAAAAEAAKAEADAKAAEEKAVQERLAYQRNLAQATDLLLSCIQLLIVGGTATNYPTFAKFRKELQPLAETYGVRIVLVGDKSKATLVKA